MDFWTQEQIDNFIGIEKAFVEFCEADLKLNDLDSRHPGLKSEKFEEWYTEYCPVHDAATERFVDLFREKNLVVIVWYDDKEVVLPPGFWDSSIASLTLTRGKLTGLTHDDPDRHLENSRAVLRRKDWEKWINPTESSDKQEKPRRNCKYDVEAEAKLRNSIEMVLATARTEWPDAETRPEIDVMAKELERLKRKDLGYKFEAIRKILRGTYRPSVRHGIPGL